MTDESRASEAASAEPAPERDDRDGVVLLGRSLPLVLLVLGVGVVVAMAAGGGRIFAPPLELDEGWGRWVRIAGALAAFAGLAALRVERGRIREGGARRGADPTFLGLRVAATIMGVVALLALVNPPPPSPDDPAAGPPSFLPERSPWGADLPGIPGLPPSARGGEPVIEGGESPLPPPEPIEVEAAAEQRPSLLRRLSGLLRWVLLGLLVLLGLRFLSRRLRVRTGRTMQMPVDEGPDAEAVLETSLRELAEAGGARDPRGQITRAYHRLLAALAALGAPREPWEAPYEHLRRALAPLGVRPEPLHRLAGLYVRAQFAGRPVTDRHRAAAVEALELGLRDLRAHRSSVAASTDTEGDGGGSGPPWAGP